MTDPNAPPAPLEALADGRYALRSLIDRGGMALVYRARDTRLEVDRAIKLLNPQIDVKSGARKRFETEARTMARLHHRHIVTVHDVGHEGPFVYIVMELCEGGNLRERVRKLGPLPARMAARAVIGVLDALQLAHEQGVIHRDIKPHNVLMTREGVAKLTDFGIAHVEHADRQLTQTGAVMGTWAYMAPEQRTDARSADARADVYSVGASLYFLLTGKEPNDLYVAEDIEVRLNDLPAALAAVIRKATRYKPEDRYVGAAAMLAVLQAALPELPDDPLGTPPLAMPLAEPGEPTATGSSATLAPHVSTGGGIEEGLADLTKLLPGAAADKPAPVPAHPAPPPSPAAPPSSATFDNPPPTPTFRWWYAVLAAAVIGVVVVLATSGGTGTVEPAPTPAPVPAVATPPAPEPAPAPAPEPTPTAAAATPTAPEPRAEPSPPPAPTPRTRSSKEQAEPSAKAPAAPVAADGPSGMLYVMSRPWSQVSVDGKPRGKTGWSASVSAGSHRLKLETSDGRVHEETVDVSAGGERRLCWDFATEAACSR